MHFRKPALPRLLIAALSLALLVVVSLYASVRGRPALVEIFPAPGAEAIPAYTPLRLTFSRPMLARSVETSLALTPAVEGAFSWEGLTLVFAPSTPWPAGQTITVRLSTGARSVFRLPLADSQTWSFTVMQATLAYLWPASGPANLYALDLKTGAAQQLTAEPAGLLDFSLSPDGATFYYTTPNAQSGATLHTLDRLTGQTALLFDCGAALCGSPTPNPAGTLLAYTAGGRIWLLLGQESLELEPGRLPLWSPRGVLGYFSPARQAYLFYDPATGATQTFPNQTGEQGAWSPDGGFFVAPEITHSASTTAYPTSHLIRFNLTTGLTLDLSQAANPLLPAQVEDASPAYAPTGSLLAFGRKSLAPAEWAPGRQLWLMEDNGTRPRPLTNAPLFNHTAIAWNPASTQLAYMRANQVELNQPPEIWLIDPDGHNPTRLVIGGYAPQWLP